MDYTELERFGDALIGVPKDRVPVFAGVSLWAATNYPEADFKKIASDPDLIVKAQLWARDLLGVDAVYPLADPLFIAEAFGCDVRFSKTGPIVDPLSLSTDSLQDIESIPFPDPRKTGRFPVVLEAARQLREKTQGKVPVVGTFEGAFTNTCRIIEVEQILRMTYKKREVLEALLDRMNAFLIEFGEAYVESGVNVLFLPEPTASSTMISPRMFRQYVLPRVQEFCRRVNVPTIFHICGDTGPILEAMGEAGAGILSLDQCMDLGKARTMVPHRVIAGNVDPVNSLLLGDAEQVRQDSVRCLQRAGAERFILMPGCSVPPTTPEENLRAMVRAAVDYGLGR